MTPRNLAWRVADVVLLLALAVYVFAGVPKTPFHGDEGMQVYATLDYFVAVVQGNLADLPTNPPYTIDSRPHLRLINGTLQRYAAGFVLYTLRDHNDGDLQLPPGWNWGLSYTKNVDGGWLPKDSILYPARYTSAAFFALSIPVMFALGWLLGGRAAAYPAAILYALNRMLLLNARRAMMEGSLLLFGLLVILLAAWMAQRITEGKLPHALWWVGLILAAGLTVASKHNGALFVMVAWLWLLAAMTVSIRTRPLLMHTAALFAAGIVSIALFVALSPALWSAPLARMGNLIEERSKLLEIQVAIDENAPSSVAQRALWTVTQPYIERTQYYELTSWRNEPDIALQVTEYERSGLGGLPRGWFVGVPLTLLLVVGFAVLVQGAMHDAPNSIGLLMWVGVMWVVLLLNPLPWQRYYLPLLPATCLITGVGVSWICQQFPTQTRVSPVAADGIVSQTRDVP